LPRKGYLFLKRSKTKPLKKSSLIKYVDNLIKTVSDSNSETYNLLTNLSPETIATSYARISRDPRPINELRKDARKDVEKARKSYSIINFGMGHKSIAEHVQLNFDITNISRRAVEEVESKRLQGYTEKSQRYITLDGDFTIPQEIKNTPFEKEFVGLIDKQNKFYDMHLVDLINWHSSQDYTKHFESLGCLGKKDKEKRTIEGYGKEDARYAISLATHAQLGMTTSARNLEVLISKLNSSDVLELNEIGKQLLSEVNGVAPSVIKYTDSTKYFSETRKELEKTIDCLNLVYSNKQNIPMLSEDEVKLFHNLKRDDSIVAGLIFSSTNIPFKNALNASMNMPDNEKILLLKQAQKYQEKHDPKLREYELGDRVAEFVMSSSAFAQMKRHRMNTVISQSYNPNLGSTIPLSIKQTNLKEDFNNIMNETNEFYSKLIKNGFSKEVAQYVLTNAHKRRVLYDANNRQIHAFGSERLNLPAQWDIRNLAKQYVNLLKKESPLTLKYVCGKDRFDEIKGMY
jgi:thymidylate synthase ThyX